MLIEMGSMSVDSQKKKKIALVTTQPSNSTPWNVVQRTGKRFVFFFNHKKKSLRLPSATQRVQASLSCMRIYQ